MPLQTVTAQNACTLEGSALASPRVGERTGVTGRISRSPSVLETEVRPPGLQGFASGER